MEGKGGKKIKNKNFKIIFLKNLEEEFIQINFRLKMCFFF